MEVESFCTTIEVKSHSTDGVFRKGTDWYVKCGAKEHDVTYQSNTQKESLKGFFTRALGDTPYITDLIWFTDIGTNDLKQIYHVDET